MCDISVIVALYNVEEYLAEALDSLLRQGDVSLQAILVDDGSTDQSSGIARAYAAKYDWIEYHRIDNGGPGRARNYGVSLARGKYLAFLDADDLLPDRTYERMLQRAEKDGSELTICHVDRFNSRSHWNSPLHDRVFRKMTPVSHVRENHALLYDTTSWNKLILRSFYLQNSFSFPEGILYEDIPLAISVHCLANQVSLLFTVGYHWRVRDGETKSITQNTDHTRNLDDRITALRMLNKFMEEKAADPALQLAQQVKTLEIDLLVFINKCKDLPRETALQYLQRINAYIDEAIEEAAFAKLRILDCQKYLHVRSNDLDGLLTLLAYDQYPDAPVTERDGGLYVDLPGDLFTISDRSFTEELGRKLPRQEADAVSLSEKELSLKVFIYRDRYNIAGEADQRVTACLYDELSGEKIPMEAAFFDAARLTEESGTITEAKRGISTAYCYDGAGVTLSVDLENADRLFSQDRQFTILVEAESRYFHDRFLLAPEGAAFTDAVGKTVVCGDCALTVGKGEPKTFLLKVDRQPITVNGVSFREGGLTFDLSADVAGLWAKEKNGDNTAEAEKTGERSFTFRTDGLADLQMEVYADLPKGNGAVIRKRVLAREKTFDMRTADGAYAFVGNMGDGGFKFIVKRRAAVVEKVSATRQQFRISAVMEPGMPDQVSKILLKMEAPLEGQEIVLASADYDPEENGGGRCSFTMDFKKLVKKLYSGRRRLFVELVGPDGDVTRMAPYSIVPCNKSLEISNMTVKLKRTWFGEVFLQVKNDWEKEESSPRKRKRLIVERYPAFREEEIQPKTILFEALQGAEYGGTPRAVYEYIIQKYPEYRCVWSLRDPKVPIAGKARRVRKGSLDYYHELATVQYLISNESLPNLFVRREGQTEILFTGEAPAETAGPEAGETFASEKDVLKYIRKNKRSGYLAIPAMEPETFVQKVMLDTLERVKAALHGLRGR